MGVIEIVVLLSLYTFQDDERHIEGWYHQDNLSTCLASKRFAERNAGKTNKYTCSVERCVMKTDSTGAKHCDKIVNE
tara:strand:+ start:1337 stop:1567 length:231 start_codon:yes stop_codon:yes gene_type:complete